MDALVHLRPSLPADIHQKYGIQIVDYQGNVSSIRFEGPLSGIEKAHSYVKALVDSLLSKEMILEKECHVNRLEKIRKQLKDPVYMCYPESSQRKSIVVLYSFDSTSLENAVPVIMELLSFNAHHLGCKPEEAIYLKLFKRDFISQLPAKVTFNGDKVILTGNKSEIQLSMEKMCTDIFEGLLSGKFAYTCNPKSQSLIEQTILRPLKLDESTFQYTILKQQERERRKRSHHSKDDLIVVYIYSRNPKLFEKVSESLQLLDPCSKFYRMPHKGAEKTIKDVKFELENWYKVQITHDHTSSVTIHGLYSEEVQRCYDEIKQLIESSLITTKFIPVSHQVCQLLKLYQTEFEELRRNCSRLTLFPPDNDTDNGIIEIHGSIRQVNDVKERLMSGLLRMEISIENFDLSCPLGLIRMWSKRWNQIKEQEEKRSKVLVTFQTSKTGSKQLIVMFEVIGASRIGVQEAKDAILSEGVQTVQKVISLSPKGTNVLFKAKKEKRFDYLTVNVNVGCIDTRSRTVTISAPKKLAENLTIAEEQIQKFVGDSASTSHIICTKDPVISLILLSPVRSVHLIKNANAIAGQHRASVQVQKKPSVGLRISGSETAIAKVKPLIQTTVIEIIEKTIGEKQVPIKPLHVPLLSTTEFTRFQSKLESDLCVTCSCSKSKTGTNSELICSSSIQLDTAGYVKVDICKGDLVYEQVDAIVNAANEDLNHIEGLAKAISDAGGASIQMESDDYIRTNRKVKPGQAVCLGAGDLPCKKVIHAIVPRWMGGRHNEEQTLYSSVFESLKAASGEALSSIAFPAIGTGHGKDFIPKHICAKASLKAVKDFCLAFPQTTIHNVKFVLTQKGTVNEFKPVMISGLCGEYQYGAGGHSTTKVSHIKSSSIPKLVPNPHPKSVPNSPKLVPNPRSRSVPNSPKLVRNPLPKLVPNSPPKSVPNSPPKLVPSSPLTSNWQWLNSEGLFSFDSVISRKLTAYFQSSPKGSVQIVFHGQPYIFDFAKMKRINTITSESVQIIPAFSSSKYQWLYQDGHAFLPYSLSDSRAIENMYQANNPGCLVINNEAFIFNFSEMRQVNLATHSKRQIKRLATLNRVDPPSKSVNLESAGGQQLEVGKDVILTLRGPRESLNAAEDMLLSKLKSSICSQVFDNLPENLTPALRRKIQEIARKNDVLHSFESVSEGGRVHELLKVEGICFKVEAATHTINEEILTFHVTSTCSHHDLVFPQEWQEQSQTTELFQVDPDTPEWEHIERRFHSTMSSHKILKITRIQNKWLWEKYAFQKKRLDRKNRGLINEMELFHGTQSNDPKLIYEGEDGFDMRYGAQGMWGVANYFAVSASYSDNYAHQTLTGKEIFLVKVLTGSSYDCPPDETLRMPPAKPGAQEGNDIQVSQMKYDTVTGHTSGSQVFMTYDNDKAYPAYLITYN